MTLRLIVGQLPSLTGFKFGPEDIKERPELTYHRMVEAFNFAAAKETYLTDPLFSDKTDQVKGAKRETDHLKSNSFNKRVLNT